MTTLRIAPLLLLSGLVTSAASAQVEQTDESSSLIGQPSGVPIDKLFGVPCKRGVNDDNATKTLLCLPRKMMESPSAIVAIHQWEGHPSHAEIIADARRAFHASSTFNVVREENFGIPRDPKAVGFRGVYQTNLGNRYVWSVFTEGRIIRVTAAVYAPTDVSALIAEVEQKVFGVQGP